MNNNEKRNRKSQTRSGIREPGQTDVRILLVDDHPMVRLGMRSAIDSEPGMKVVADASNGVEAIDRYREHKPDVVLMDLRLPGADGVETTQVLLERFPEAAVIFLSTFDGREDIKRALAAGARTYLQKNISQEELVRAIREVTATGHHRSGVMDRQLRRGGEGGELTPREREVLRLIVAGLSNKEIGARLEIAEGTVKLYVSKVLNKLGLFDRTQAAIYAVREGVVHLDGEPGS